VRRLGLVIAIAAVMAAPVGAQWAGPCDAGGRLGGRPATRVAVATTFVGGNLALYEYFRRAWWSGERAKRFTINWEQDDQFRQADKFGHALGGYHLARAGTDLLRAACASDRSAVLWGSLYAAAFQLQIELWDATQAKYGFSPNDVLANTAGTLYHVAQRAYPTLRHVKPTFSYSPSAAYRNRATFAPGSPSVELRPSLDYSGQTYWMSADVKALLPADLKPYWPGIVRLSFGHSITDFADPETGDWSTAEHQLLLSLDLDPEKLPGNHPVWKFVKHQLSYYRFPAPALQITPTVRGIRWYR